jgi:hypothetical protein
MADGTEDKLYLAILAGLFISIEEIHKSSIYPIKSFDHHGGSICFFQIVLADEFLQQFSNASLTPVFLKEFSSFMINRNGQLHFVLCYCHDKAPSVWVIP